MSHRSVLNRLAPAALVLLLLCATPRVSVAQESVKPLAVDEKAFGLSLADWATAWAQWWLSIPTSVNPRNDRTGARSGTGQRMPVWFIAPEPEGTLTLKRTVLVPPGAWILLPGPHMFAWVGPGMQTEAELASFLSQHTEGFFSRFKTLDVTLDGSPLPDIRKYRVRSGLFTVVLPPNNLLGVTVTAGMDHRVVAILDGYFHLLPPLSVGKHVLDFRLLEVDPTNGNKTLFGATLTLIVQNPNEPLP